MRIVCPNCQATYDVPESLLVGAPRRVRCARCTKEWLPEAPPAGTSPDDTGPDPADASSPAAKAPAAPAMPQPPTSPSAAPVAAHPAGAPYDTSSAASPALPSPHPADRLTPDAATMRQAQRRMIVVSMLGWVASVAALAGLAWAAFVWRDSIMAAWEPSKRLYAALGLI